MLTSVFPNDLDNNIQPWPLHSSITLVITDKVDIHGTLVDTLSTLKWIPSIHWSGYPLYTEVDTLRTLKWVPSVGGYPLQCTEGIHFSVQRVSTSVYRGYQLQCIEGIHFSVRRVSTSVYGGYPLQCTEGIHFSVQSRTLKWIPSIHWSWYPLYTEVDTLCTLKWIPSIHWSGYPPYI
jgi:hypothetical protein